MGFEKELIIGPLGVSESSGSHMELESVKTEQTEGSIKGVETGRGD